MASILSKIIAIFRILKVFYWINFLASLKSLIEIKTLRRTQINWSIKTWEYLKPKLFKFKSKPLR